MSVDLFWVNGASGGVPTLLANHYHRLAKQCLWVKHFTNLPKRRLGALSSVKDCLCYSLRDSMLSNQIIGQTTVYWYKGAASL